MTRVVLSSERQVLPVDDGSSRSHRSDPRFQGWNEEITMHGPLVKTTAIVILLVGTCFAEDPSDFQLASVEQLTGECVTEECDWVAGCDSCGSERWFLFPQQGRFHMNGWIDAGFIGNVGSPNSKFNGPYNAVDRSNELMLNQLYLIAERDLLADDFGVGGRIDLLYGEDYLLAESTGLERQDDTSPRWNNEYYGLAFPQAYLSLGSKSFNAQVGHFYSPVGYEGVMSTGNFFYSHSYSYQFAGPFTHWGAMLNWNPTDAISVQAGLVNGWDAIDRVSDSVNFVGKIRYETNSGAWTSFAIVTGNDYNNLAGLPGVTPEFTNRTRYSLLAGIPMGCNLEYVFHHWLGLQEQGSPTGGQANWYGIDQYLYWTINDMVKTGVRFEWFRDEDGTRVGLNRPSNPNTPPLPGSFYSLTYGFNVQPTANVTIRPEIRSDWYHGDAIRLPYQDGQKDYQLMIGCDAIFQF